MIIALDYDNTYTRDKFFWDDFIDNAWRHGHSVYIVTSRGEDTPVDYQYDFNRMQVEIIYCNYRAKKQVTDNLGVKIDIWVDDDPEYIGKGFIE